MLKINLKMHCEVAKMRISGGESLPTQNEDIRGLLIGGKAFQAKTGVSSNVVPTQLLEKGALTSSLRLVLAVKRIIMIQR